MKLVTLLHSINESKGLSKKDAMLVLREIETGRGGIAELAEKNPYLRDLSQDWIRDNIGEKVPLFRAVGVPEGETFREEGIVSGTTDWGVALRLAQDFPTIFSQDKTIHVNPHLVRYDIPVDRVLAYVPALVDMAVKTLGKEFVDKKRIVGRRYYSLISLHDVVDAGQTEKEVVADVSDIDPQVLKFSNNVTGRKMLAMVRDIGTGKYENPEQYLDFTQKHSSSFYTPAGRAEMLQRVGDQAGPMHRFLGESRSFLLELQLPRSPQFYNWFKGSEVTTPGGDPIPVFHGTEVGEQFDTPHAWSHFGTSEAANAILGLGRDFQLGPTDITGRMRNMRIMPFYLNIKNPLELHDYGEHNPDIWIRGIIKEIYGYGEYPGDGEPIENINNVMKEYGIPPEAVRAYANITRDYNSMYNYNDKVGLEHGYYEWLTQVVEQAGYDGIVYKNDIEDAGSTSWVPIHQNQIMSAITAQAMTEERYRYIDPDGIDKYIVGDGPESVRHSGSGVELYRTNIYAIAPGHTGEIIKKEDGLYFVADQHNSEAPVDNFPRGIDSFELVEGDVLSLEQKLDQKKTQQGKMSVFDYDNKWGERYVDPDPDMDKLNDVMRVEGARMKPEEFQTKWNEPYWGGSDDFGSTSKSRSSMWLDDDPYADSRIDPSKPSVEDWVNWASYGIDKDEGMDPEQLRNAREMFHDNPVALRMLSKLKPKLKTVESYDDIFGSIIK